MPRALFRLALIALLWSPAACGSGSSGEHSDSARPWPWSFHDGFESGLTLWAKDYDVPPLPGDPTQLVGWSIEPSTEEAFAGVTSARFDLDGSGDDGTIWLERTFDVAPNATYDVELAAAFWSQAESFNTTAVVAAYAGPSSPERESDFDVSQVLNQVAGWKMYTYVFPVTSGPDGLIHVGIGLSVVWETWITYYADEVSLRIEPR